jgi:hypothetical protein
MLLDGSSFDKANAVAIKIVSRYWHEIQKGRSQSSGLSFSAYRLNGRAKNGKRGARHPTIA